MAQHFLLSAASRTLSLRSIYKAGEEAAYDTFKRLRWPETDGEPVCPKCGCLESYSIATRRRFKCKACHAQFSVTSGTIFASRKLAFVDLLAAICITVNAAKGVSAVQLSRDIDVQYKTAFVLAHKIRESLGNEIAGIATVSGEVEIDGAYVGGHVRPENRREDRKDRRLKRNLSPRRRVVVALRERRGRTLPFIVQSEAEGVAIARERVTMGAALFADEASHWDALHAFYQTGRVNHSETYSTGKAHTNFVESYFSRLRRMIAGQHHHVSPRYLHAYANHAAWLEDHRREANGSLAHRIVGLAMASPISRTWKGYWQRRAG